MCVFQPELAVGDQEAGDAEQAEGTAEEEIVVWKGPVTPRPWESLGSEIEVDDEKTVEHRAKVSKAYEPRKDHVSRFYCNFCNAISDIPRYVVRPGKLQK